MCSADNEKAGPTPADERATGRLPARAEVEGQADDSDRQESDPEHILVGSFLTGIWGTVTINLGMTADFTAIGNALRIGGIVFLRASRLKA